MWFQVQRRAPLSCLVCVNFHRGRFIVPTCIQFFWRPAESQCQCASHVHTITCAAHIRHQPAPCGSSAIQCRHLYRRSRWIQPIVSGMNLASCLGQQNSVVGASLDVAREPLKGALVRQDLRSPQTRRIGQAGFRGRKPPASPLPSGIP